MRWSQQGSRVSVGRIQIFMLFLLQSPR